MWKLVLPSVFVLLFSGAASAQVYKWTDEQGRVHYGDCPPPRCNSTEVDLGTRPRQERLDQAREQFESQREERQRREQNRRHLEETERLQRQEQQRDAAQRRNYCQLARSDLRRLEMQRAVYYTDEQGNRVYLDDEERTRYMQQTREDIRRYCDP